MGQLGGGRGVLTRFSTLFQAISFRGNWGIQEENNRPAAYHRQTLSHNVVSSTPRHEWDRH